MQLLVMIIFIVSFLQSSESDFPLLRASRVCHFASILEYETSVGRVDNFFIGPHTFWYLVTVNNIITSALKLYICNNCPVSFDAVLVRSVKVRPLLNYLSVSPKPLTFTHISFFQKIPHHIITKSTSVHQRNLDINRQVASSSSINAYPKLIQIIAPLSQPYSNRYYYDQNISLATFGALRRHLNRRCIHITH